MSKLYTLLAFLLIGTYSIQAQTWEWTSHVGSTGNDNNSLVCFDNQGSVFVTGNYGADFTMGGQNISFTTWSAHFLSKYDLDGQLIWVKPYGDHKSRCKAIATDRDGNLYVTGNWNGSSMDIDGTTLDVDFWHGNTFVAKYDNDGNLLWATNSFTGIIIEDIAVDKDGNVAFAGGYYHSSGVYFGGNNYDYDNTRATNQADGVVGKFDADGKAMWLHTFNGADIEDVNAIGVDPSNNVYIAGRFNSDVLSLDNSATVLNKKDPASDGHDLFIVKYGPLGQQRWIKHEGGNATVAESAPAMDVDEYGNVTVISDFRLENLLIDNTKNVEGKDWCTTTLIAQYNEDGALNMATSAFGSNRIIGTDIATYEGKIYLTGSFGAEFSSGGSTLTTNGGFDCYIAELDNQGNWNWAVSFGGDFVDTPQKLTFDNRGNLYVSALTNSTNPTINNTTYTGLGGYDYLFGKLDLGLTSGLNSSSFEQITTNAFPNPASDKVLIDLGENEISGFLDVVNISGKLIQRLDFTNQVDLELDLSTYPKGVYFVKINALDGVGVVKVVKQ